MSGFKDDGDMDFIGDNDGTMSPMDESGGFVYGPGFLADNKKILEEEEKRRQAFIKAWEKMPPAEDLPEFSALNDIEPPPFTTPTEPGIKFEGEVNYAKIIPHTPVRTDGFDYRYGEGEILKEIDDYVRSTYGEHYAGMKSGTQFIDLLMSDDDSISAFKFTIGRYVHRFGKKSGMNRKDLLKAAHYLIFLLRYTKE